MSRSKIGETRKVSIQRIFTMRGIRRFYPPDREVMKGINRSFSPGAKIGIPGDNGAWESLLLKIMVGLDDDFTASVLFHDPGLDLNSLGTVTTCDFVHPCFDVFSGPLAIFTQTWIACARTASTSRATEPTKATKRVAWARAENVAGFVQCAGQKQRIEHRDVKVLALGCGQLCGG